MTNKEAFIKEYITLCRKHGCILDSDSVNEFLFITETYKLGSSPFIWPHMEAYEEALMKMVREDI